MNADEPAKATTPVAKAVSWRIWLLPAGAAVATGLLLLALFTQFLPLRIKPETNGGPPQSLQERLVRVRSLLRLGRFRLAVQEIDAVDARKGLVEAAAPEQRKQWQQLEREAAIYANLCAEPLEDLLEHAADAAEDEWLAAFAVRYHGKAFIFDATVYREPAGYRLAYDIPTPKGKAQLVIDNLDLVKQIDPNRRQRVIFGVRLASIQLEAPGPRWVVRFLPASDVLLTDGSAAALCCPPLADEQSQMLLRQQGR